jgi:uncharacterized Zn finger protein (UPF0148 family)
VEEVKKHAAKIKKEAQHCLAERQARMNKTIDETHKRMDKTEKVLQSIYYLLLERETNENKRLGRWLEFSKPIILINFRDRNS